MKKYTIAVVGALGNVGTEIRDILEKSELTVPFPHLLKKIYFFTKIYVRDSPIY